MEYALQVNLVNLGHLINLDPRGDSTDNTLTPTGEVKKVHIGIESFQVTQIGLGLSQEEEEEIIKMLRGKVDLFTWKPSNMLVIDPKVACHNLT